MAERNQKYILRARALRQELGLGYGRVDPVSVLRALGVEVTLRPLAAGVDVDGAYEYQDGRDFVFINTSKWPLRQRFTAAHELGHHLFDRPINGEPFVLRENIDNLGDDRRHRDINVFAGAFLIDAFGVKEIQAQGHVGMDLVAQVVAHFEVSVHAAALELKELGAITNAECEEAFASHDTLEFARANGVDLVLEPLPTRDVDPNYWTRVLTGFLAGYLTETGVAAALRVSIDEAKQMLETAEAYKPRAEPEEPNPFLVGIDPTL